MAQLSHARMSGEDRRRQLIEVAIDLFSRKGFGGTTTREIAAAAGVTEAIIFRHFATKQDLYTAILDYKRSDKWLEEAASFMAADDDEGLFRWMVTSIINKQCTEPRLERLMIHAALEGHELAVMHHNQMNVAIGAPLEEYIRRRQQAGALRDCNPSAVLFAVAGVGQFYAMHKYMYQLGDEQFSDEQMINDFVRILMTGLTGK